MLADLSNSPDIIYNQSYNEQAAVKEPVIENHAFKSLF